jgi:hypothetical protein
MSLFSASCVVVPENVTSKESTSKEYDCKMSLDKKTLKVVNLLDGDTSFYEWNDEFLSIVTMPTSVVLSGVYTVVNNVFYVGEKVIRC